MKNDIIQHVLSQSLLFGGPLLGSCRSGKWRDTLHQVLAQLELDNIRRLDLLLQNGFKKAAAIKGGLSAWEKAGGKMVRP